MFDNRGIIGLLDKEHGYVDFLTSYSDVMPTILDLCAVPPHGRPKMEGSSLLPLLNKFTARNDVLRKNGWEIISRPADEDGFWTNRAIVVDTQRIPYPLKWRLSCVMKGSMRLINGSELFDLRSDSEKRVNISTKYSAVVSELRKDYDMWWSICARQFDNLAAVHIGSSQYPLVKLTTMSLRNEKGDVVFLQVGVRVAQQCLGWWDIYAERDASYIIALRRWPEETLYSILDGIKGCDVDQGPDDSFIEFPFKPWYADGSPIDVNGAAVKLDNEESVHIDICRDDVAANISLNICKGDHKLRAWFLGQRCADSSCDVPVLCHNCSSSGRR